MADEEKESPVGDEGRPSRLFLVLAFMGLGLLVLVTDWVMKLILPAR
ncbi:MAG TPA: hypothetical protein VK191_07795 [Symbiobacteriaceae bacterium]|nr:hypothetical protein [Symbiobacteriaceae bacterium]